MNDFVYFLNLFLNIKLDYILFLFFHSYIQQILVERLLCALVHSRVRHSPGLSGFSLVGETEHFNKYPSLISATPEAASTILCRVVGYLPMSRTNSVLGDIGLERERDHPCRRD